MTVKLSVLFFLKADQNADFAVTMKKMTLVKILKNTWLVLFAEIIVSDKECLILRNFGQALSC